jgi:hypothetical protein
MPHLKKKKAKSHKVNATWNIKNNKRDKNYWLAVNIMPIEPIRIGALRA